MSDPVRPQSTLDLVATAGRLREEVQASPPLTHCLTNAVVTGFTANVLLALGAAPAMVDIVGEAEAFAGAASGLLINLGTPTPEQREASRQAVTGAVAAGTPWVLDPANLKSKCKNTPFDDARFTGRVARTIVGGRTVYEHV